MKSLLFKGLSFALLFVLSQYTFSQKTEYSSLREALFSAGQLNGQGAPANLTWIENGEKYSFTKTNNGAQEIWTHDMTTGDETLVFSGEGLSFPETNVAFRYREFQWTKDFRYIRYTNGKVELYDHTKDPFEWNNVAGDPAYKDTLNNMHQKLNTHLSHNFPVPTEDDWTVDN